MHIFTVGRLKKMLEAYPDDMPICGFDVKSGRKCIPVTFHFNEFHRHFDPKVKTGNRTIKLPEIKQPTLVIYID